MADVLQEVTGLADSLAETALNDVHVEAAVGEVLSNVDSFREWLNSQPHISWLTDNDFLSHFVSATAEDISQAKELLLELLAIRKKHGQWFANLDPTDPKFLALIDQGWFLLLPEHDDSDRQLYIIHCGLDATNVEALDWQRGLVLFFDYVFLIDNKDKGNVTIADFSGATLESFSRLMPRDVLEVFNHIHANLYPSQVAAVHYINCPANEISDVIEKSLENHDASLNAHETLDQMYAHVPMRCLPVEYLPADYTGPNAGTIQDLIAYTKATLTSDENRARIAELSSEQWGFGDAQEQQSAKTTACDERNHPQ